MKLHNGRCNGNPCSRYHFYKCAGCGLHFRTDLETHYDDGKLFLPLVTWPYCCVQCAEENADEQHMEILFANADRILAMDEDGRPALPYLSDFWDSFREQIVQVIGGH